MRSFRPGMAAAIALGIYHSLGFMYTEIPFYLGDIITSPSSKEIILTRYGIVNLLVSLLPVFVFQVLFGSLLYKEFCSIGVYVFSRRVDRRGWFIRKAMQLFAYAFLFRLLMHLTQSGVLILSERLLLDQGSIILLLSDVAIYALWMYLTALATNMLAMRLGSTAGFAIIYTLQALMLSLLMIWESRILSAAEPILSAEDFRLLWMNPIAHLVLGWHSSAMNSVDGYIRKLQLPFDLSNSILIFIGMSVLITWVSWKIVQEQELINTLER